MVKKSLIAIVLIGMLASTSFAGDKAQSEWKFDDGWPADIVITYEVKELCQIPIYIDVGMYVELQDCGKKKIILRQLNDCGNLGEDHSNAFPCYRGCTEVKVRANFEAKLGTKLYEAGTNFIEKDRWTAFFVDEGVDTTVGGPGEVDIAGADIEDVWIVDGDGNWDTFQVCVEAWDVNIFNGDPDMGPMDKYDDDPNAPEYGQYPNYVGEVAITVVPTAIPDICDYADCD